MAQIITLKKLGRITPTAVKRLDRGDKITTQVPEHFYSLIISNRGNINPLTGSYYSKCVILNAGSRDTNLFIRFSPTKAGNTWRISITQNKEYTAAEVWKLLDNFYDDRLEHWELKNEIPPWWEAEPATTETTEHTKAEVEEMRAGLRAKPLCPQPTEKEFTIKDFMEKLTDMIAHITDETPEEKKVTDLALHFTLNEAQSLLSTEDQLEELTLVNKVLYRATK